MKEGHEKNNIKKIKRNEAKVKGKKMG